MTMVRLFHTPLMAPMGNPGRSLPAQVTKAATNTGYSEIDVGLLAIVK